MADAPPPRAATVRAGLTPGAAVLLVASVVIAFVLADVFVLAHRTIGWVVACSVVALLIDPVVTFVSRLLPRWMSVVLVLIGVLAVIGALVAGLATDLLDSIEDLKRSAPVAAESLQERYEFLDRMGLQQRVTDFVEELDDRIREDAVNEAIGTAPTYVVTGILMLFLLAYGRRYFEGFADQFGEERRERIRRVGHDAATRGRRYLLVVILQSVVNGVIVGLACWWYDLDAAFSLGFVAGSLTVIPLIGVVVGGIPALLLAFGLQGWSTALALFAVLLVLQAIEALVVRPYVDARTVRVGQTVPIIVGLLALELYGPGGAVYAIALAVIGLAALDSAGGIRGEEDEPATT